ncbi:MAG: hypothetical protein WC967_09360 [Balneolaceae bacterium]
MKDAEIIAMQKFLATKKIPVPVTGIMDKATTSAYQTYRASLGVPYPANTYLPATRNDLPRDMKLYVDMCLDEADSQQENIQENTNTPSTQVDNTNDETENSTEDNGQQQQDLDEEDNEQETSEQNETQQSSTTTDDTSTEVKVADTKSDGIISKLSSFVKK